jgi:all-trans-8'-apo-beta-carotenal 15,15'-oxygenase
MTGLTRRTFAQLSLGAAASVAASTTLVRAGEDWRLGFKTPPAMLDGDLKLIEGRLPTGLEGHFFRVGPAQFERAGERLGHWFDGDGMVQRFTIAGGRVRHRGRFVDTAKRRDEEAAGRFVHTGYGFAPKALRGIKSVDDFNAANTSVLAMAGEVWALWEGGSPYRIGIDDLATRGRKIFDGSLDGAPFSAHPKTAMGGDTWNFGVIGKRCVIWNLAPDGTVRKGQLIELPEPSLMHDFAVTPRHLVLLLPPMIASDTPADTLVDRYRWHADKPLIALVLDKNTLGLVRRYELPARFLYHIGNAWEDNDGTIRLDAFTARDATFATKTARDLALLIDNAPPTSRATLMTLHADGRATSAMLPGSGEFPRTDPRRVGERHRYTYGVTNGGVARWDWQTGTQDRHDYGDQTWSEEPVFIPRPGGTDESDGWVIQTTLNYRAARTELCILDARRVSDGPIAKLACLYPIPLGFHGAFVAT